MAKPLQFAPFSSAVDHGFWFQFGKNKLELYKLNTDPVSIYGYYSNNNPPGLPARFSIDYTSFDSDFSPPPKTIPVCGVLHNFNTLDDFKNADKKRLIENVGKRIWNDILSGEALKDPQLLNRFLVISYADLKKFNFYYWFGFPSVAFDGRDCFVERVQNVRDSFSAAQIEEMQEQYDRLPTNQRSHFAVRIADDVTFHPLEDLREISSGTSKVMVGFSDPCSLSTNPGWPLRNLIVLLSQMSVFKSGVDVLCFRDRYKDGVRTTTGSVVVKIKLSNLTESDYGNVSCVGWEKNERSKFGPRLANLSSTMDPIRIAESAVDLNLKLMKWRVLPELDLDLIKNTKCLLLGSGTLGCNVARGLLGWGVRHITLVDNANISYSNPVRQSLFAFADSLNGGKSKCETAANSLKLIFPGVDAVGVNLSIPMPGHSVSATDEAEVKRDVEKLESLIRSHDAVYLLLDTRESRWLPTLLAARNRKIVINAALGFDTYLVMRHGAKHADDDNVESDGRSEADKYVIRGSQLGCYFCNDVVAPSDSTRDRTLDQQCTVSRPGCSMMAAAYATELLISLLQHERRGGAPASLRTHEDHPEEKFCSVLGLVPHQIRGFLSNFCQVLPATAAYDKCSACSSLILEKYESEGFEFLLKAFDDPSYLEDVTGLTQLHIDTQNTELWELSDDESV